MSIFPAKAALVSLLVLSILRTTPGMAQSTDTTPSMPMDHSAMTPAQHAAMHGGRNSTPTPDTSFAALQARGKMAMGVDQYASAHRFDVLPNGGRIAFEMKDGDSLAVAQIRAHMKLIEHAFQAGDFSTPEFVHARAMPGTDIMSRNKALIRYTYADLPRGGEVRITTTDSVSLAAIREFLTAQRGDHKAGH
ncbi:MAG TPA: hypothetical protein VK542_01000 [Gemmatimonadaceae bacterium]|nr:hypothetical protein [Gemmatimonadaceae bacterium]